MTDYNFFEAYQKKRSLSVNIKSPVFLGVVVIFLIVATSAGLVVQDFILASQLSDVTDELSVLQTSEDYQDAVVLQDSITALTEYGQNAEVANDRISEGKILGTEFLSKLTALMPSTSSLQSVNITRVNAALNIYVPDQHTAAELVAHMEESELFLQTTLESVNKDESTGRFIATINCTLKAGDLE